MKVSHVGVVSEGRRSGRGGHWHSLVPVSAPTVAAPTTVIPTTSTQQQHSAHQDDEVNEFIKLACNFEQSYVQLMEPLADATRSVSRRRSASPPPLPSPGQSPLSPALDHLRHALMEKKIEIEKRKNSLTPSRPFAPSVSPLAAAASPPPVKTMTTAAAAAPTTPPQKKSYPQQKHSKGADEEELTQQHERGQRTKLQWLEVEAWTALMMAHQQQLRAIYELQRFASQRRGNTSTRSPRKLQAVVDPPRGATAVPMTAVDQQGKVMPTEGAVAVRPQKYSCTVAERVDLKFGSTPPGESETTHFAAGPIAQRVNVYDERGASTMSDVSSAAHTPTTPALAVNTNQFWRNTFGVLHHSSTNSAPWWSALITALCEVDAAFIVGPYSMQLRESDAEEGDEVEVHAAAAVEEELRAPPLICTTAATDSFPRLKAQRTLLVPRYVNEIQFWFRFLWSVERCKDVVDLQELKSALSALGSPTVPAVKRLFRNWQRNTGEIFSNQLAQLVDAMKGLMPAARTPTPRPAAGSSATSTPRESQQKQLFPVLTSPDPEAPPQRLPHKATLPPFHHSGERAQPERQKPTEAQKKDEQAKTASLAADRVEPKVAASMDPQPLHGKRRVSIDSNPPVFYESASSSEVFEPPPPQQEAAHRHTSSQQPQEEEPTPPPPIAIADNAATTGDVATTNRKPLSPLHRAVQRANDRRVAYQTRRRSSMDRGSPPSLLQQQLSLSSSLPNDNGRDLSLSSEISDAAPPLIVLAPDDAPWVLPAAMPSDATTAKASSLSRRLVTQLLTPPPKNRRLIIDSGLVPLGRLLPKLRSSNQPKPSTRSSPQEQPKTSTRSPRSSPQQQPKTSTRSPRSSPQQQPKTSTRKGKESPRNSPQKMLHRANAAGAFRMAVFKFPDESVPLITDEDLAPFREALASRRMKSAALSLSESQMTASLSRRSLSQRNSFLNRSSASAPSAPSSMPRATPLKGAHKPGRSVSIRSPQVEVEQDALPKLQGIANRAMSVGAIDLPEEERKKIRICQGKWKDGVPVTISVEWGHFLLVKHKQYFGQKDLVFVHPLIANRGPLFFVNAKNNEIILQFERERHSGLAANYSSAHRRKYSETVVMPIQVGSAGEACDAGETLRCCIGRSMQVLRGAIAV